MNRQERDNVVSPSSPIRITRRTGVSGDACPSTRSTSTTEMSGRSESQMTTLYVCCVRWPMPDCPSLARNTSNPAMSNKPAIILAVRTLGSITSAWDMMRVPLACLLVGVRDRPQPEVVYELHLDKPSQRSVCFYHKLRVLSTDPCGHLIAKA